MSNEGFRPRRPGVRIVGIAAMAKAVGVSRFHLRQVLLGNRKPSTGLAARIDAWRGVHGDLVMKPRGSV